MDRSKWVWMPHAGHFICSNECQFHLNTYVGGFIVSTVGEYFPSDDVREILAKSRGVVLTGKGDHRRAQYMKKIGFEEIGFQRKYETMVFRAERSSDSCCPFRVADFSELDSRGYNDPGEALAGHMELCEKWATEPSVSHDASPGDIGEGGAVHRDYPPRTVQR